MNRPLLGLAIPLVLFLGTSAPVSAEDRKVDFDQGPSVSAIVQTHEKAKMAMIVPLAVKIQATPKAADVHTFGSVFGPFLQRTLESQPYKSASELLAPIKLLPAQVQAPLTEEWKTIESVRLDLLDAAKPLDVEDGSLYDEAVSINKETPLLQKRLDDLNADIDNYNRQCAGQPVNQFCQDWFGRIATAKAQLSTDIGNHNKRVDVWNGRYNDLSARAAAHNKKVDDWEASIGAFAARASKALDDGGISTLLLQAQSGVTLEASDKAQLPRAIALTECLQTMDRLWNKLSRSQQAVRINAREAVNRWMRNAAAAGGSGPTGRQLNFYDKEPHANDDPRFDLWVIRGRACVPDAGCGGTCLKQ